MRRVRHWPCFVLTLAIAFLVPGGAESLNHQTVQTWAHKLGFELSQFAKYSTNHDAIQERYKNVEVKIRDGKALVQEIAKDIKAMMEAKISAIKRIMDAAETLALSALTVQESSEIEKDDEKEPFYWVEAKNNTVPKIYSDHFGGEVSLNESAVHVPTTVYAGAPNVMADIKWSQQLDKIFINNYQQDPSLLWQYFGSSGGFMRQYPGINWKPDGTEPHNPDLFDCRTRSWYIEAATSPKDVLILVDVSGSMTGMNAEIARHVVNNILDTLGNNDYVNIITFSNVTIEAVPCFGEGLVQANLANIRELKNGIAKLQTERIANFSLVLTQAFEVLKVFREEKRGAACNQAIMLVTDGVPDSYKEIFQYYNWDKNPDNSEILDMPVRIFTYLIGREVADVRDVRWMACGNRGYFVHLSTLAEVREQILNYIPVMARPLVLKLSDHPTIWTPVYADIADPKITDWLWDKKEREEQKERYWIYRNNKRVVLLKNELDRNYVQRRKRHYNDADEIYKYRLMTSVSMPVFDRRTNANITEQVLVKEAYWVTQTRETRIANLLGVAGTDVPVDEIKRFMMPHMLGVHGYAFIVTNNGYILTHPDLRPVFHGILKPAYNSVDMAEVELVDNDSDARDFDDLLLRFREDVVNQKDHSDAHLDTKFHYEDMKRVGKMRRKYDSAQIENTTFTVVVSLPLYGHSDASYRVHAFTDIHRLIADKAQYPPKYFNGSNWRVHPEWLYCKYHFEGEHKFNSSEHQLLHFLQRASQPLWNWGDIKQLFHPPEHGGHRKSASSSKGDKKNTHYCDRDLVSGLVYDAMITEKFADPSTIPDNGKDFQQRFGFTLAFMATSSGLTRWQDAPTEDMESPSEHFSKLHPRAIDEIWYKRAVEQHYVNPDSFVYSVPIDDEGANNSTLVTASRAIFIGNHTMKAPAAVVGFQMMHSALQRIFQNITSNCDSGNCEKTCADPSIQCYLVDNHGYIVAAKEESKAGQFFGSVEGAVMKDLIRRQIFESVRIFDYQAVCFRRTHESNDGNILLTPFKTLTLAASWLYGQIAWSLAKAGFYGYDFAEASTPMPDMDDMNNEDYHATDDKPATEIKDDALYDTLVRINRTRPVPCDQKIDLYLLRNVSSREYDVDMSKQDCTMPYIIQPVSFSNMIMLIVDTDCKNDTKMFIEPEDVIYVNMTLACQKAQSNMTRRRPQSCIRSHPREGEIKDLCGVAAAVNVNMRLVIFAMLTLWFLASRRYSIAC